MTGSLQHAAKRLTVLISFLLCFLCAEAARAQNAATIHGVVTDAAGARVTQASVVVVSLDTNASRTTESNGAGVYSIPQLPPGRYQIRVQKPGFETIVSTAFVLTTAQDANMDFSFHVGSASTTVDVSADTELLDTSGASLSTVVQGRQIEDMPLNGRNVLNLVTLVAGVVPQSTTGGSPVGNQTGGAFTTPGGFGNYQIGGGFAGQETIYIDGAPMNFLLQNNYVALDPTQDAIREFRVETNNISPRFGGFNGGVINMTTRSGTNNIHGTAYEYLRNRVLNANNFFNNRNHVQKPPFTQNQYGVAVGGPIKRDRSFAFFSWENFSARLGDPLVLTVPTTRMRNGDFGEIKQTIYDPCGGTVTTAGSGCPSYSGGRTAFQSNAIPQTRLDPTALQLLKFFPTPNLPGYLNNYAVNGVVGGNSTQFNGRVDQTLTANQRLFVRLTYWHVTNPGEDPFRNGTGSDTQNNVTWQPTLGYIYAITPKTVFDLRLSWVSMNYRLLPLLQNVDESQFGPGFATLASQMEYHFLPDISSISDGYTTGCKVFSCSSSIQDHLFSDYDGFFSLTHVLGRHTLEAGGEYRTGKRYPGYNNSNFSGIFTFDRGFTAQTATAGSTSGWGLASFLLGYASSGSIVKVQPTVGLLTSQGYYINDNFQATRKLNLSFGVRWDQPGAQRELHDLDTVFLPNRPDPLGTIQNPATGGSEALTGQLALVNSPQYPTRYERNLDWGLFSPRTGLVYSANSRLVLRGGFGISFIRDINVDQGPRQAPINQAATPMVNTLNGGISPANTLSNPFPNITLNNPVGRNPAAVSALSEGQSFQVMVPSQGWPYTEQWNVSLEQQLSNSAVLTLAYAGSQAVHLTRSGCCNANQLPDQYDSLGQSLFDQLPNPLAGKLPANSGSLNAATVSRGQLLRPYPQFQTVTPSGVSTGQADYNALEATLQQRFRSGGTVMAAYTWSRLIDNSEATSSSYLDPLRGNPQDYTNLHADRAVSSYSAPNRLVVSYVVDLPFGRGKRFLNDANGFTERVLGGWSVNGISTFQSGFPVNLVAQGNVLSYFGVGTIRPNVVPGCVKTRGGSAQSRLTQWFNTTCFSQPAGFGNESRNDSQIRSAGIANWDAALMKTIPFEKGVNLQFTSEFFNLFNRVQFGVPNNVLGSGIFGVVSSQYNQPRLIQFSLRLNY